MKDPLDGAGISYNQRLVALRPSVFMVGSRMPLVIRSSPTTSSIAEARDVLFQDGQGGVTIFRYRGETPPEEIENDPLAIGLGWNKGDIDYYVPEPGSFDMLFRFSDGQFCRLTLGGEQFWYGPSGRLERIYDRYPEVSALSGHGIATARASASRSATV